MSSIEPYANRDGLELMIHVDAPAPTNANVRRPAVLFFHGGGWRNGGPEQFSPFAKQLNARGFVTGLVQYRLIGKTAANVMQCVDDALAAWDWLHANANRFAIDAARCGCAGGSAGGHLSIMVAAESIRTSRPVPAGLLLFNPVVDTEIPRFAADFQQFPQLNPMRRIEPALPSMMILHGQADEVVSSESVETFASRARQSGSSVDLHIYPDQSHGFFNPGRATETVYADVCQRVSSWAGSLEGFPVPPSADSSNV